MFDVYLTRAGDHWNEVVRYGDMPFFFQTFLRMRARQ
jgi:hypothetical protein